MAEAVNKTVDAASNGFKSVAGFAWQAFKIAAPATAFFMFFGAIAGGGAVALAKGGTIGAGDLGNLVVEGITESTKAAADLAQAGSTKLNSLTHG